jgi:pimeloyl-ACP methyl ester carboxylesterase
MSGAPAMRLDPARPWRIVAGAALLLAIVAAGSLMFRADIPFSTLEAKYANGQSRFMDLPGAARVHYRDQGRRDGPVIVMIHGYSASLDAWEPWVARLKDRYRIVTLDLPGHGLTRAPSTYALSLPRYAQLVDTVATTLGLGPYVVVGNSMGGGVAWTLALSRPDRVRALVLVDSIGLPAPPSGKPMPFLFKVLATPLGKMLLRVLDTRPWAVDGLKSAYVDPALVTPALIDRYVELSLAPGHRSILLNGDENAAPVTVNTFKAIRAPTLVLHGDADAIIPVASGRALAAAIPGARFIDYPRVGHVPMEQIPDRSAQDLDAFIQGLTTHRPSGGA